MFLYTRIDRILIELHDRIRETFSFPRLHSRTSSTQEKKWEN
jgi:hypothetical protein